MPEVTTNTSTITATGTVQAKPLTSIVMADEVTAACQAIAEASELGKQARAADALRDQKLMVIFEKTLGVKTLDEVKALDPAAMAALLAKRMAEKAFSVETGTDFDLKHKGEKRNPAWKDEFIAVAGEAKANEVLANTQPSHTWHVIPKKVVVQKIQ